MPRKPMLDPAAAQRIEKTLRAIAHNDRSGASQLALRAVRVFARARPAPRVSGKDYIRAVTVMIERLKRLRPAMSPIHNAVTFLQREFSSSVGKEQTSREAYRALQAAVRAMENDFASVRPSIFENYRRRFSHIRRPMVISYSSQVIALLTDLPRRSLRVTVCESRPALEGRRTARLLARSGRRVTIVTEAQVPMAMRDCDAVLLGCDTIFTDGSLLNKTGSHVLALAARSQRRRVIAIGDRFKLSHREVRRGTGQAGAGANGVEEHPPGEIWKNAPSGIDIRNVYFERVPAKLVTDFVLDSGVYSPRQMRSLWRTLNRKNRKR